MVMEEYNLFLDVQKNQFFNCKPSYETGVLMVAEGGLSIVSLIVSSKSDLHLIATACKSFLFIVSYKELCRVGIPRK